MRAFDSPRWHRLGGAGFGRPWLAPGATGCLQIGSVLGLSMCFGSPNCRSSLPRRGVSVSSGSDLGTKVGTLVWITPRRQRSADSAPLKICSSVEQVNSQCVGYDTVNDVRDRRVSLAGDGVAIALLVIGVRGSIHELPSRRINGDDGRLGNLGVGSRLIWSVPVQAFAVLNPDRTRTRAPRHPLAFS